MPTKTAATREWKFFTPEFRDELTRSWKATEIGVPPAEVGAPQFLSAWRGSHPYHLMPKAAKGRQAAIEALRWSVPRGEEVARAWSESQARLLILLSKPKPAN